MPDTFIYERGVQFYETDLMGVVHHSNYLRFFEEARVAWIQKRGVWPCHVPYGSVILAVIETQCHYQHPVILSDVVKIQLQARREGLKIHFRYAIFSTRWDEPVMEGRSVHVPVDGKGQACRLPKELKNQLEKEPWTAIWP